MASRFAAHARRRPEDTAVVWRHTGISYRELYRRACHQQERVARLGLAPGAPVAVRATKSPDAIALILALLGDGRPFLLPPSDLGDETFAALADRAGCVATLSTEDEVGTGGAARLRVGHTADSVCFMLTTSGSTGLPKIVPLTAGAVDEFTDWAARTFHIGPQRTVLNYAPLNFDLCLLDIWTTLAAGGRVVLVEADRATRAGYLHDLIDRHEVDVVQAVPMLYQLLLGHGRALAGVSQVISTGDALTTQCLTGLPGLFPNARFYNLYGCTETNDSFLHEIDPGIDRAPLPIGEPVDGVDALLVDTTGEVFTGSGVGELFVSTPFQTHGYLGTSNAVFVAHPRGESSRRYFRSGDLVRRDASGALTLEGRADFHVKVRGVRVNTQAVERTLLDLDDITEAVVFAVPDPVAGNALHAVIRRTAPKATDTLTVRAHCARRLPRAAVPTAIHLVDEPLPTTSTGKPDRTRIKHTYQGQR
nr:AMP-binding protein [Kibdelosporangium sp. MJ126-NF4]CEL18499.1 putative non-ribosomal peptide synthetase [Kibdelosporangium sp. MJ126-NF4]CTQ97983.1 putative non-ribosomal peptide synthetase [Kibdelosporangium sp. MJ126-NF4]